MQLRILFLLSAVPVILVHDFKNISISGIYCDVPVMLFILPNVKMPFMFSDSIKNPLLHSVDISGMILASYRGGARDHEEG